MEKLLYSKKGKFLFLVLQHICVLGLTVCITFITVFSSIRYSGKVYEVGFSPFGDNATAFEKTSSFRVLFRDSVDEITKYAVIREQMETDGVFDGKKRINIEEYAKRFQHGADISSNAEYYLEDLIKWGQYGVEDKSNDTVEAYDSYSNIDVTVVTEAYDAVESDVLEDTSVTITIAEEGLQEEALQEATTGLYEVVKDSSIESTIMERYHPIGGEALAAYTSNQEEYNLLVGYLIDSVESLSYNYYQYKQFQTLYQRDNSNIRYYIETGLSQGGKHYSNLPETVKEGEEEAYMKALGTYICYDAKALSYTTNSEILEEDLANSLRTYEYAYSDNSKVFIGLDMTYPAADVFSVANDNFKEVGRWLGPIAITVVLCACFAFVLFILLTIVSGKRKRDDEVHLLWFDGINTECSVAIAMVLNGMTLVVTGLVAQEFYYKRDMLEEIPILSIMTIGILICHMLLMFFYLSLVRRIKSHTLWKNSITYRIWSALKRGIVGIYRKIKAFIYVFLDDGKVTTRTWIPYLLFLLLNFVCLSMKSTLGSLILLAILGFDLAIGYYIFRENLKRQKIIDGIEIIKDGDMSYQVDTTGMHGEIMVLAESVNTLGAAVRRAIETSMKDERLKAELITNVSHDIKTPLTSIINYVDLIKREEITDEKVKGYIAILDAKSQRLKHLTEDLVEASKISSGNITLQITNLNLVELLNQTMGEFSENFDNRGLRLVINIPEKELVIEADSRRMWRVFENLFRNIEKYAMENTRVYLDVTEEERENGKWVSVLLKNISKQQLNIDAEDLTQRFIRGDISRSTEGSGLGLSIAKNLVQLQGGTFAIHLDGDLFKAAITFPMAKED